MSPTLFIPLWIIVGILLWIIVLYIDFIKTKGVLTLENIIQYLPWLFILVLFSPLSLILFIIGGICIFTSYISKLKGNKILFETTKHKKERIATTVLYGEKNS